MDHLKEENAQLKKRNKDLEELFGSSEENHLPNFRKSDVIDDDTMTLSVGDDVTCQFS